MCLCVCFPTTHSEDAPFPFVFNPRHTSLPSLLPLYSSPLRPSTWSPPPSQRRQSYFHHHLSHTIVSYFILLLFCHSQASTHLFVFSPDSFHHPSFIFLFLSRNNPLHIFVLLHRVCTIIIFSVAIHPSFCTVDSQNMGWLILSSFFSPDITLKSTSS